MILQELSGPVIGAVIGYCTNYIAVKMLFYPRKEIKIWGHKLPFTPGAIPKGKPRLAKAIGSIVATTLLSEEDIKEKILSSDTENAVVGRMMNVLSTDIRSSMIPLFQSEEKYEIVKDKVAEELTNQILEALDQIDIGSTIAREGERVIKEKIKGTMLEMFLTEDLISSFIQPMGGEIMNFINENGKSYIEPEVLSRVNSLEESTMLELLDKMDIGEDSVRQMAVSIYHTVAETTVSNMLGQLNIAEMIADKINKMSVEDLEKMVLSVMKKELDTIVNLGALVGGLLGIINMFF